MTVYKDGVSREMTGRYVIINGVDTKVSDSASLKPPKARWMREQNAAADVAAMNQTFEERGRLDLVDRG